MQHPHPYLRLPLIPPITQPATQSIPLSSSFFSITKSCLVAPNADILDLKANPSILPLCLFHVSNTIYSHQRNESSGPLQAHAIQIIHLNDLAFSLELRFDSITEANQMTSMRPSLLYKAPRLRPIGHKSRDDSLNKGAPSSPVSANAMTLMTLSELSASLAWLSRCAHRL
ncbi:hypothetical protein BDR07DRAFT_40686 [Suillus spraguei]|nr:hypothetical protein BDR07DRAFT_40686 [Suillus spraguei]